MGEVAFENICILQFLSNGVPGSSHTYSSLDGTVTISALAEDIDSTVARSLNVVDTLDRWHRMLDVMCDLDTGVSHEDIVKAETTKPAGQMTLEVGVGGADFTYEYTFATGVLVVKARAEATISYGAFRYLIERLRDFLALLPQE